MSDAWFPAYVGLGSNLETPASQLRDALAELAALPQTRLVVHSRLYRSAPMGPQDQPDFVNAVAGLLTHSEPLALIRELQRIERAHGRDRRDEAARWGPRTLDLDLLAYAQREIDSDELVLPHPGIAERSFVLIPWSEFAPAVHLPGLGRVGELARMFEGDELAVID